MLRMQNDSMLESVYLRLIVFAWINIPIHNNCTINTYLDTKCWVFWLKNQNVLKQSEDYFQVLSLFNNIITQ